MPPEPQSIDAWHDFYMFVGAASTTLLGLLFVAISLHLDRMREGRQRVLRAVAAQTYSGFLAVIILSAIFLVPAVGFQTIAWSLLVVGGTGLARTTLRVRFASNSLAWRTVLTNSRGLLGSVIRVRGAGNLRGDLTHLSEISPIWNFVGPGVCNVALLVVAYHLFHYEAWALYWLVAVACALIVIATGAAWDLLMIGDLDEPTP